jgi:hypothetical protein
MNARQIKKNFKKQISKLKSDNDLMRRIISDSPKMQELYDLYNKPLNVTHTTIPFQEYKVNRVIPRDMEKVDYYMKHLKKEMASDLFDDIEEDIVYSIHSDCSPITITASISVGRKNV